MKRVFQKDNYTLYETEVPYLKKVLPRAYSLYRSNPDNINAALNYAVTLAKKHHQEVFVYSANQYGRAYWKVTFKKTEAYTQNNIAMNALEAKQALVGARVTETECFKLTADVK